MEESKAKERECYLNQGFNWFKSSTVYQHPQLKKKTFAEIMD
jgi:hypothetical protein